MAVDYKMSFIVGAALAGSFGGVFSKAGAALEGLQKKVSVLDKNREQIERFGKTQNLILQTSNKLDLANKKVNELGAQINASSTPSEELKLQFIEAQIESHKLQEKLDGQSNSLGKLQRKLSEAGVDAKIFSDSQARLAKSTEMAAQVEKYRQAQDRLARSQGRLDASKQAIANMKGDILASAGILMAFRAPIDKAASFEQAVAKVGAVSGASGDELAKLSDQARQLGRDTQFSASEAAAGQEMLARAGFKTNEIIQTMPGLLNMAAAEGMELSAAADIASSTLRGFQLSADQSGRVADVLAKTSAASNTSIAGIGESMKMVAPIAAGLKIPFEETAAMIGAMGDSGIKGSEAGTALRAALIRLAKEPKQTEAALARLGVATRDVRGNMRTIPSLMAELSQKMAKMGNADKMGALSEIFGTEAASGMLAVMDAAESGKLKKLTGELNNAKGAAAKMAEQMNATAQGALRQLGSATESLMIDIGNVLLPTFTSGVEALSKFAGTLSDLTEKFPLATKVIVGGIAALGAYKVGFTAAQLAWTAAKLPFQHLQVGLDKLNAVMVLNGKTSAVMAAKTKALAAAQSLWNTALKAGGWLLDVGKLAIYHGKQILIAAVTKTWTAAQWLLNAALNANPISLMIVGIAALITAGYYLYRNWDKVCAWISAEWGWVWDGLKAFWSWFTDIFSWVWGGVTSEFGSACDTIVAGWNATKGIFSAGTRVAWDWLTKGWESAKGLIMAGWTQVSDAIQNRISKVKSIASSAWSWMKGIAGAGEDAAAAEQAVVAAQLGDITMLNKMSEQFAGRVGEMTAAWQPFKQSLGEGFQAIWDIMTNLASEIQSVVIPSVNMLASSLGRITSGVQSIAAVGGIKVAKASVPVAAHAAGGIFDRPHLGLVAEAGTESIIPHNASGEKIWQATGEINGFSSPGGAIFSPTITLNVQAAAGTDGQEIGRQILRAIEPEFGRLFERYMAQKARVAYS